MTDKVLRVVQIFAVVVVLGFGAYYVIGLKTEISDLRKERIAADSLKRVAENQYELKVREVASEKTLRVSLGLVNDGLLAELKKKDAKIRELSVLVIRLKSDSAHGEIIDTDPAYSDSGEVNRFDFTLESDNGIVSFNGFASLSPRIVRGVFTFKRLPPISIVLYEDDLQYVNARIGVDESLMDIVSFDVQAYKPALGPEGFRFLLGAGPARTFDDDVGFGLAAMAGVTWRKWGVSGVIGPNMYSLMLIKSF